MPGYWIKPFGFTRPERVSTDLDWTHFDWKHEPEEINLDSWEILSGPAQRQPPKMGKGDFIVCHAVNHARVFAAGELLDNPTWRRDDLWKDRWPWVFHVRIDVWVPLLEGAPKARDIEPSRALGAIQRGAPYAEVSADEYKDLVEQLLQVPSVRTT